MNDIEYILRIVLKARDEMAAVLAKARAELTLFSKEAGGLNKNLDGLNSRMNTLNNRLDNVTNKLSAWRSEMRSFTGESDKAGASVSRVSRETDNVDKSVRKANQSQKDLTTGYKNLSGALEKLNKDFQAGKTDRDDFLFGLQRIRQEAEKLARSAPIGDQSGFNLAGVARQARQLADEQNQIERELTATKKRESAARIAQDKAEQKASEDMARNLQRAADQERSRTEKSAAQQAQLRQRINDVDRAYSQLKSEIGDNNRLSDEQVGGLRNVQSEYKKLVNDVGRTSTEARRFSAEAERISNTLRSATRDSDENGNSFVRLTQKLDNMTGSFKRADNVIREVGWAALFVFIQQATSAVIGLVGELGALASSAIEAGAALGGGFVAAGAQALPVIGLLVAAFTRVKAVMDAVKQANTLQQQQFVQGKRDNQQAATQASQLANAHDAVRNAIQGVARAHQTLHDAQQRESDAERNLHQARLQAKRDLEDLIAAEKQAEIAAENAVLAQKDAQEQLRQAVLTGGGDLNIQEAQVGVQSATEQNQQAQTALQRARQDAARGQRQGVEGSDQVRQAREQLQSARQSITDANNGINTANRSLDRANRGLTQAQRNISNTAGAIVTAQGTLQFMLSQLSPAERGLYNALTQLQKTYHSVFIGDGKHTGILGSIIDSFTTGVNAANTLLHDPRVVNSAKNLADTVGAQFNRITKAITTPAQIDQFLRITEDSRKNLAPLTTGVIDIGKALTNIAEEASPALSRAIQYVDNLIAEFLGITQDQSKMTHFFNEGEKHLEAWLNLVIAIGKLFGSIIGISAPQGLQSLQQFTKYVNGLTRDVQGNRNGVAQFFRDAHQAAVAVLSIIPAIGKELVKSFNPDTVQNLVAFINGTLIPTLGSVIRVMGTISNFIVELVDKHPFLQEILKAGFFILFFGRLASPAFAGLNLLAKISSHISGIGGAASKATSLVGGLLSKLGGAVGLLPGLKRVGDLIGGFGAKTAAGGGVLGKLFAGQLGSSPTNPMYVLVVNETPGIVPGGVAGAAGEAEAAGEGALASEGAAAGGIFGGAASKVALGLLKKAGWIGLGISAGQGLISGFKHHSVTAGFQDFFHSVSFGLIKSFDESAKEAVNRVNRTLAQGRNLNLTQTTVTSRDRFGNTRDVGTQQSPDLQAFNKLTGAQQTAVKGIEQYRTEFGRLMREHPWAGTFDQFYTDLQDFSRTVPPEFRGALSQLVREAQTEKDKLDRIWSRQQLISSITTNFGLALQAQDPHISRIVENLINQMKKLPPASQKQAEQSAIDMANGLAARGVLTKKAAGKIRDDIVNAYDQMHKRAVKKAAQTAGDTADAMSALANVIAISMGGMISDVNDVLRSLGFGSIKIPKKITSQDVNSGAQKAGQIAGMLGGLFGGSATGGFIGGKGQRSGDIFPRMLGAGEAVLNWAHQRVIEPALNAYYGYGLNGVFQHTRGQHGMAAGGFVAEPGTNFRVGEEPQIVAALRRLATRLHEIVYGISGYRSPQHSVAVGGFANDPHTQGRAADIGIGSPSRNSMFAVPERVLRSVGLYRPYYPPDPNEVNHVELLGAAAKAVSGIVGAVTGGAAAAIKKIKAPNIPGNGPLSKIAQKALNKVANAANQKVNQTGDTPQGGGAAGTAQVRRWATQALKITNHFTPANLSALIGRIMFESGGNPKAINLTDINAVLGHPSKGLAQTIDSTFQKYRLRSLPNDIYDPIANLVAAIRYMYARYGHIMGNTGQGYASGGIIPGREGAPVSILGHAGEWIINKLQQSKIAQMLGVTPDALRSMLGFTGSTEKGAQGGAQLAFGPGHFYDPTGFELVAGTRVSQLGKIISQLGDITNGFMSLGRLFDRTEAAINIAKGLERYMPKKVNDFVDALNVLTRDGGIFDTLRNAVDRRATQRTLATSQSEFRVSRQGVVTQRVSDAGVSQRQLIDLRKDRIDLVNEQNDIASALDKAQKRLKSGKLTSAEKQRIQGQINNLTQRLDDARQRVADNTQSIFDAQNTALQDAIDGITNKFQTQLNRVDFARRIGSALGNNDILNFADAASNQIMAQEMQALQAQLAKAKRTGTPQQISDLQNQINDLQASIVETAQQMTQRTIDTINTTAQNRTNRLDMAGRLLDATGAVGQTAAVMLGGERFSRSSIFQQRTNALVTQRTGLQSVLRSQQMLPVDQQNRQIITDLTNQILDLDVTIKENTRAAFQAKIDDVNSSSEFNLNINDLNKQIIDLQGQISGNTDQAALLANAQQRQTLLTQQGNALQALLVQAQANNDQQAVNDLTTAILENKVAVLQNTQTIDQLNGTITAPQTFSSSAWRLFRQAIFTGLGNVLPQFNIPVAQTGGYITKTGLFHLEAGEIVRNPSANIPPGKSGDTNINLYGYERPVDITEITAAIGFAQKTAQ